MTFILIFILTLLASWLFTFPARSLGPRLRAMDVPGELSIHMTPTPRTGGLAMLGALLVAAAFLVTTGSLSPDDRVRLAGILAAAVIVGLLGLAGDRRMISSNVEFSLLLIPSAVIVLLGIEVRFIPLKLVSILLTLFYLLGGSAASTYWTGWMAWPPA